MTPAFRWAAMTVILMFIQILWDKVTTEVGGGGEIIMQLSKHGA